MYFELKENRPHGTPENPFSQYHISDVKRAFQIPVHWHDELEIIYVKQGKLHVTISGKNAENTDAANIEAQFETKITLIKFIQKMWSNNLILENGTNGTNTIEKEMITYIRQNYTREISLKEFGAQFHLSEKYISCYFKEHFHITLSQYINHLRLEHARQLLEESATSVTEVAMCSGYQNVSYFIRSFKKMYGVSPLKYRKASCII